MRKALKIFPWLVRSVFALLRRGIFTLRKLRVKMVVGNGFEPLKALADRFTVCTL